MNTTHLQYFIEIADLASINKAAKKLLLNRSSLNVALKALENELGFPLLTRSAKGVSLTANGKRVYDDAKAILQTIEQWRALKPEQKWTVNFYLVPAINNIFSVSLLSACRKQSALIDFHSYEITNDINIIEPTLAKDNTIILGGYYTKDRERLYALAESKHYVIHELFKSQFVVYLNKDNPNARRKGLTADDLALFEMIMLNDFSPSPFSHLFEQANFNTSTFIPLIFDHLSTNPQAATILPNILEKPLRLSERNIGALPLVDLPTTMNYFLIYKQSLNQKKAIHDFITFVLHYPFIL